jgi:starvation-inducible DNA-binding protein
MEIGLTEKERNKSIELLNKLLADEFVLLAQTLNYHWNLIGPEFHDYHLLFDAQYKQTFEDIDMIAERVRALDGRALGSMEEFIKHSQIKEEPGKVPEPKKMVTNLEKTNDIIISFIRKTITEISSANDHGTVNFLSTLIEQHEKTAWMLRSLTK